MNNMRLFFSIIFILLFYFTIIPTIKADPLYDQCMAENPYGTNSDWAACGGKNWKRLDNQLNAVWKIVLASYDRHPKAKDIRKSLVAEQRAWLNYREDVCAVYESGYWGREGQVLSAPNCNNSLLANRIDELRNHYCYQEKCGFDQQLEPYFVDVKAAKLVLSYFETLYLKQMFANQGDSEAEIADTEKSYGINFVKDASRDQKRFENFLNKACLFTHYVDNDVNNNFQYQSCQTAIIDHRIQQLTSGEVSDPISKLSDFANIGKISQKGDWLFGCDQGFSCTAIGYPNIDNIYDKGQYIAIHWQYNSTKPPLIRFIVASNDQHITSGEFIYHFSNPNLKFKLINDSAHQPVIFAAHIGDKDSANFIKALLSEKELTFGVDVEDLPRANISLKEFADFYNTQKDNANALFGNKIAPLPKISALAFTLNTPIALNGEDSSNCQSDKPIDLNIRLNNGEHFIAVCDDYTNRYTDNYRLQKQNPQGMITAQFDGKANLSQENWLYNLAANNAGLELRSTIRFSSNNDCGRDFGFVYNGKVWQLSTARAMPFCALVQQEDWPQLYNSNLVKQ
ncbi:DUF1311 domain-containing protein [Bartonella sp. HY329]|uniref:lysozyme inhibitor LprI family protein n=1 Tax=unclassified Bartonella TaxID=2645622 RepID=UPI0021C91D0D|nr:MULTISPECIES: lysozyme inhibitor LprI family protein [unclassified Bartonella]UXM95816.1 DUF1311 domain-containing protein [Bartonella sp. HY329]UXN10141.1 DUF1311 domain-containing protein [Bartonella sp. HY328]